MDEEKPSAGRKGQAQIKNSLLAALPSRCLKRLRAHFEPVPLSVRQVIQKPNEPIDYVLFPQSGLLSTVAVAAEQQIEVGIVGRDGMSGICVVLGADSSPNECFVQVPGEALRMSVTDLRLAFDEEPALRVQLLSFVRSFLLQLSQTALANGRCSIEERLARWLLLANDRLDGDEIPLTHGFLALMLGVRRASVTHALNTLEAAQVIRNARGLILILDRAKLEEIAGDIYSPPPRFR